MDSITFTIGKAEVEKIAGKKLSQKEIEKILSMVENDMVLWEDIQKSLASAIEFSKK